MTWAPISLASWTATWPTPPAAAWISTRSPGRTRANTVSACQAVIATRGTAAACAKSRFFGFRASAAAGAAVYSAYAPRGETGSMPYTSSPGTNRVTPAPTRSTVPATSLPGVQGRVTRSGTRPDLSTASPGLTPAPPTRTSTSPGPGSGTSVSV